MSFNANEMGKVARDNVRALIEKEIRRSAAMGCVDTTFKNFYSGSSFDYLLGLGFTLEVTKSNVDPETVCVKVKWTLAD